MSYKFFEKRKNSKMIHNLWKMLNVLDTKKLQLKTNFLFINFVFIFSKKFKNGINSGDCGKKSARIADKNFENK